MKATQEEWDSFLKIIQDYKTYPKKNLKRDISYQQTVLDDLHVESAVFQLEEIFKLKIKKLISIRITDDDSTLVVQFEQLMTGDGLGTKTSVYKLGFIVISEDKKSLNLLSLATIEDDSGKTPLVPLTEMELYISEASTGVAFYRVNGFKVSFEGVYSIDKEVIAVESLANGSKILIVSTDQEVRIVSINKEELDVDIERFALFKLENAPTYINANRQGNCVIFGSEYGAQLFRKVDGSRQFF